MKHKNQFTSFVIAFGLFLGVLLGGAYSATSGLSSVHAEDYWPADISISAGATATVMDITNGTVLYDNGGTESHYPASITKLMTALVAVENSTMDEIVTFSETAVYENEGDTSHIARDLGEEMTMEQCLYGMLLESANECAYAIGEHVGGGDFDKFVEMMNAKAAELGCVNTHFTNSNGLHDDNHWTCSYDMALIASAAYKEPAIAEMTSTRQYIIPPTNKHTENTVLNNSHAMISNHRTSQYLYEYALGGKTGFTDEALHTMVTYAEKDGLLLVCVVMNESDKTGQYGDTLNLLNYCFDNFIEYDIASNIDLGSEASTGPLGTDLALLSVSDGKIVLPKTAELSDAVSEIVSSTSDNETVAATIQYTYAGHIVGSADLLYATNETSTYPFHNVEPEDGGSEVEFIRVDYRLIIIIIVIVLLLLIGVFFLIHALSKNPRRRRSKSTSHSSRTRTRNNQPTYKVIDRKKRRRRRRRR